MINSVIPNFLKLFSVIIMALLTGIPLVVSGQIRESAPPSSNPKLKILYPDQKFDAPQAKAALARGTSMIKGQVCSFSNGKFHLAENTPITLFPMTPYFEAWYKLKEDKEDKNTIVRLDMIALEHRIDSRTNSRGEFQFTEMKPGRYFVFAVNEFTDYVSRSEPSGTVYTPVGPGTVYEWRTYAYDKKKRIEKIVEIKSEGQTEKVNLRSGFGGLMNIGTCKSRLSF